MATVSVALIVKNEERTLGRCLQSIHGTVDEIIVVDTGSTDATKVIAAEHGARVVEWAWRDDFAAARQHAFDQATGDWVFWLDADDVVVGAERIRDVASAAAPTVTGFYWRYILARDGQGKPTHTCWRERCVRHDGSFKWAGRVHEVLAQTGPGTIVKTDEIVVEHYPEPEVDARGRRNLDILERECAANDGVPEPRLLFYLGREYADCGDVPQAIKTLERYVSAGTWADERYLAQVQVADLRRSLGHYAEALESYWVALKILPNWPDAYFGLAATYYFLHEWTKVIHWADVGRSMAIPDTLLFVNLRGYESGWIIYYTNALCHLGRTAEALAWTRTALELAPDSRWHPENLAFLSSTLGVAI